MPQPFTTKFCVVASLAATLLVSSAMAAPTAAGLVEQAARQLLQEQAARAALRDPQVVLEVVGAQGTQGTARSCRDTPRISALDTRHASRMRFAASCAADNWREEYTVRAELSAEVLVASSRIAAGQPIGEDSLRLERRVLAAPQEALSDAASVVGQTSRRALQSGQVLERRMLVPALLVRRGATVQIVARNEGIVVVSVGQATEAGRRDDVIGVRNLATGKVIHARVTGVDEVEPNQIVTPQSP